MKPGLTITKDNLQKVAASINSLSGQRVMVGVPDVNAGRKQGGSFNNASRAYVHDNGAPEANIPARPFMEPGILEAKDDIEKRLRQSAEAALDGDTTKLDRGLHAAGLIAASSIKSKITAGPFQPLAERTLEARRRRGVTRTSPLIDIGEMRAAIAYVIRKLARR